MKILPAVGQFILQIFFAAAAVALASVVLVSLRGFFSLPAVALLYLLVVVVCTTLLRSTGGIAASIISFLSFNYFFLPPYRSFTVAHIQDTVDLFVFLVVAVLISNLMARAQTHLEQIQAREQEATHLYELSSSLTAVRDENQIAELLAQHLLAVFQAEQVEVLIQSNLPNANCQEGPCIQVLLPENAPPASAFQQFQKLTTNRGQLGEIHLWTQKASLSPNELRLLQTIASQSALAVERALLSKAENRTKILEESDRLKTAILSSVSHDLRTPLASIQAAATSLYDPTLTLDPAAKSDLQSLLLEETEHLNELVSNLLHMSRIEAGALKLQKQWNSMADVMDTALTRLQRQTTRHSVEIDVPEDLPLVEIDAILIEQVFINLISNSLKYAPTGSRIEIRAFVQGSSWMQVMLLNQGPNIPEAYIEHIFEKFYTFPGMKQVSSTGLGLSICKGIVEAHGGRIWAENQSKGLSFHFTLPLSKEAALPILIDEP